MDQCEILHEGHKCPGCHKGILEIINAWDKRNIHHLQCSLCDAIYVRHEKDCQCWICKKKDKTVL